ncbi:MaoC family dehydratase N-terminal domain-containing protein [Streptomyces sp. NPDC056656]|uniref:MaoC family dehydratase n=1 Tax=Streptomyces sp. NPDC056656 TaxID=3345895 RepID=UPI0036B1529B
MNTATDRPEAGLLTDEAVERARRRTGVPKRRLAPHNLEVTADGIRHFAHGYGDGNPLWCDLAHGPSTRWGTTIAPPNFCYTMGENAIEQTADAKALLRGDPLAGLGAYQAAMEFEYYRPLRLGDRCASVRAQVGVEVKESSFGGRAAHVTDGLLFANGDGAVVAVQRGTWIHTERHRSKERARSRPPVSFSPYTADELAAIDAAYDAETRRGAEPRYFEDVRIGDEIQPRVKGPLTVTDVVVWHLGWGMQLTPPGAFALARSVRRKAPALYPPNARNIPDTVQRLHWEPERARELGIPMSYDYGGMRETWLTHALTDWMGDDAWLFRLRCEHRRFNYIGDTTWVHGTVVDKLQVEGRNEVHLDLSCRNQRGEVTTPGTAVVLLPTRDTPVELPQPPADNLHDLLRTEIARYAD